MVIKSRKCQMIVLKRRRWGIRIRESRIRVKNRKRKEGVKRGRKKRRRRRTDKRIFIKTWWRKCYLKRMLLKLVFFSQKSARGECGGREEFATSAKIKKSKVEGTPAKNEEKREKRYKEEKYDRDEDRREREERFLEYKERDRWDRERWEREKEKGERDEKLARDGERRTRGESDDVKESVDRRDRDSVEKRKAKVATVSDDETDDKPPDSRRKNKLGELDEPEEKRTRIVDKETSVGGEKEKKPKKT